MKRNKLVMVSLIYSAIKDGKKSPMISERCSEIREEIVGAHEVYRRYAAHNDRHFVLPGLYDGLARLLGGSLASSTA